MKMNKIIRVGIYIRVSTEEQAKHGYSLDSQKQTLEAYAKQKGYKIYKIYADEGKSARSNISARKELLNLLDDVRNDKIDRIIFWRLDRWFRNIQDYYKVQEILDKNDVDWECTDEEYNTTTSNGRLYLNIKLSIAQNESDQTGDRIRFNFESMIKSKKAIIGTRNCPIGYKVEGTTKNKYIVKNPDDKNFVEDLFSTYLDTMSISATTQYLVDNYPAYHFGYQTVKKMLNNTLFYGCYRGIENYCEPYLTKKEWDNIQDIMKRKNQKYKNGKVKDYIFTGLLVCPECGRRLGANGTVRTRPNGEQYTRANYRCPKHYVDKQCSNKRVLQENYIEEWLLDNYKQLLQEYIYKVDEIKEQISKNDNSLKIKKLEDKISRLNELYIDGLIDRQKYDNDRATYTKELNELKLTIDEVSNVDVDKIKQIINNTTPLEIYQQLTKANKRAFWNSFIDRMIFCGNKDYDFIVYLK